MKEQVFSIEEVAAQTPWSKTTLYRLAPKPDSPFRKRGGRWVTTESDLLEWVRSGPKPRKESENPMPKRRREGGDFMAEVIDLRKRA